MKLLFILLSTLLFQTVHAQDSLREQRRHGPDSTTTVKRIAVVTGFHAGKYVYGEIGFGRSVVQMNPRHGIFYWGASLGSEIQIGSDILFGPKLTLMAGSMGAIEGISFIYYTDSKKGTFVLRPEFGFGIPDGRIMYGYNFRIGDKEKRREMVGINSHMVSIVAFPLTIAKKETKVQAHP